MTGISSEPPSSQPESLELATEMVAADLPRVIQRLMSGLVRAFFTVEELTQDTLTDFRLYVARQPPSPPDLLKQLRRIGSKIAVARVADAARKLDRIPQPIEDAFLAQAAQDGHSPSRIVAKEQAFASVRDCLQNLEPEDRELVRLRYIDQLSLADIACQRGVPVGVVYGRHTRVLQKLREMLGSTRNYQFSSSA